MCCKTIREILLHAEAQYRNEDAIRFKKGKEIISKTYFQLRKDSESFSCALKHLDVLGKHIALIGATSYEWITAYFGIVNSASVAVPLDVSLPAEEVFDCIQRSDSCVLILDETRNDLLSGIRENCPKVKYIITLQEKKDASLLYFGDLINHYKDDSFCLVPMPENLCTIMFTSGTTGKSKGVMLTHRNLAENATCLDMKIPARTVTLSVLPIHHAYCLSMDILKALSIGCIICINDSLIRLARNILLFQPQMMLMVPMMLETLARKLEDAKNLPREVVRTRIFGENLTTICSGGAYLDPQLIDLFKEYGITIQQGYGMTECSPVISTNLAWDLRKDSVGKLLPNCQAKTVDGEIWVKGSSVMKGYYGMPDETSQVLKDGWLKTGDLGYIDKDSFVYLTGRKKNLIILNNGENVSPEQIEQVLAKHRLVREVLVREACGRIQAEIYPDYEYAQQTQVSDIKASLQKILDEYNDTVPSYKKIYQLVIRQQEFEKTPSKKIKRY